MMSLRATERLAGMLYLVTHVTSVVAVILYGGSAVDPRAPLGGRAAVLAAGLLEIVLALAVAGTAIALYPLLRRYSHGVAAGYLALRTLEASIIVMGVVVLLPVVARPGVSGVPTLSVEVSTGLRLAHDWTFLIGPGLIVPIHTVLLAALLWRARLTPRWIPALGLIGGPLIGVTNLVVMFGLSNAVPVAALPVFGWEITLALCLLARGLRSASTVEP